MHDLGESKFEHQFWPLNCIQMEDRTFWNLDDREKLEMSLHNEARGEGSFPPFGQHPIWGPVINLEDMIVVEMQIGQVIDVEVGDVDRGQG